jgi:hypothetical protein
MKNRTTKKLTLILKFEDIKKLECISYAYNQSIEDYIVNCADMEIDIITDENKTDIDTMQRFSYYYNK